MGVSISRDSHPPIGSRTTHICYICSKRNSTKTRQCISRVGNFEYCIIVILLNIIHNYMQISIMYVCINVYCRLLVNIKTMYKT